MNQMSDESMTGDGQYFKYMYLKKNIILYLNTFGKNRLYFVNAFNLSILNFQNT